MVEIHDDPDAVEVARVAPVSFHLGYRVCSCAPHGFVGRAGGGECPDELLRTWQVHGGLGDDPHSHEGRRYSLSDVSATGSVSAPSGVSSWATTGASAHSHHG